jgi:hypothetical protein
MVERQPGRPTEQAFIGAALRYLKDDYTTEVVHLSSGYLTHVQEVTMGKKGDENIIRAEQLWEGLPGSRESIRDFAAQQLARYQKRESH